MTNIIESVVDLSRPVGEYRNIFAQASLELPAPELTIVIPTFNECRNVLPLIERLRNLLEGYDWEVIFVDDHSPDGTAALVCALGKQDRRVRCIRRIGRRGLSGAFLEGALASQASYVAVMDGDLQHDESCLIPMLERLRAGDDLAVGTRYVTADSLSSLSVWLARFSRWSTLVTRRFLGITLSDPMSGFFMIRRTLMDELAPSLRTQGFKILLDIITTARQNLRIVEIPYSFRKREHGKSKLDARIALDFVSLIIGKLTAGVISARFLLFSFVGLIGLGVHLVILNIGLSYGLQFNLAQTLSTLFVIACNFTMNNILTYADLRLVGRHFFAGLIRFELVCSVGVFSNVGVASWFYDSGNSWWFAGFSGALMGAVWNYVISAAFVWRQH